MNFTRRQRISDILHYLLADIRHDWVRVFLSLVGFSSVAFSFFILASLSNSLGEFYRAQPAGRNLIIVQSDFIDPTDARMDPTVLEELQKWRDNRIRKISPVIYRHMRVNDHVFMLRSAPLEDWEDIYHLRLMNGDWPELYGEVAVGEGAAAVNEWDLGSEVIIYGSPFRISAIVESPGTAFSSIWMPFTQGTLLFGENRGYQALYVMIQDAANAEEVRNEIQDHPLIAGEYHVFFEDTYTKRDSQLLKDISSLMSVASQLALLGMTLGTFTSTSLNLTEKTRQIGILRSIGFTHRGLRWTLMIRSLLIGWIGYVIGLAGSIAYISFQQNSRQLFVLGFMITFRLNWEIIVNGLALSTVLIFLGAEFSLARLLKTQVQLLLREIAP